MTHTFAYAVVLCLVTNVAVAQTEPDAGIASEIVNTSINLLINADDAVQLATVIDPGGGGDVDILITAISSDVDPGFDPDIEVRTLSGTFLAANNDWQNPEGGQSDLLHDVIRCFVEQNIISPGSRDAVVLLSITNALTANDTRIVAEIKDVDGLAGRTVASFTRVDGSLFDRHPCSDI